MTRVEKLYKAMSQAMYRGGATFEGKRIGCKNIGADAGKGHWTLNGRRISKVNLLKIADMGV